MRSWKYKNRKGIGFGSWVYDTLIEGIEVVAWMPLPEPPRMEEK